jgi:phosphoribosyl 1,2-cyclic phosphodiesterase
MPPKITWLGTGGGRFVIINQIRASGGWILEMDGEAIHIDPGPGALVRAKQYGVKLGKLTGVIVSHAHPDHYADAEMVIEAMTKGAKVKRGFLLGSKTIFNGGNGFRAVVSPYHADAPEKKYVVKPGDKIDIGKISIHAIPTKHGEPDCLGFVFKGSRTLGFTGDGEYYPEQHKHFKGSDYLLINCLRPRDITWPMHMNADGARKLIGEIDPKPKLAILQHFGIKMLRGMGEREAKWITMETGVKTIVARDGMVLDLDGNDKKPKAGLKKFLK